MCAEPIIPLLINVTFEFSVGLILLWLISIVVIIMEWRMYSFMYLSGFLVIVY